ncbi:MAG TPA: hypothetical protein VNH18_11460 [Bryobacteraceae bacterium]|nr:hypothetical protein [Bryobacteraceae bacterium]
MRRFWYGFGIAAAFALGSFTALVKVGGFIEDLRHPPKPTAAKVFVPPPPPAVKTVDAPELTPAPMQPAPLPGVKLPKP